LHERAPLVVGSRRREIEVLWRDFDGDVDASTLGIPQEGYFFSGSQV